MNVPTPLNDTARDDRFDRGLERLLDGDPRGIDEIEPDLRDIAIHMVSLANDAGWVGSRPHSAVPSSPSRRNRAVTIINALAAVLVIGLIGGMVMLGMQVWGPAGDQFGSERPDEISVVNPGPGVCRRAPRTDAEIAAIVRREESYVYPFQPGGVVGEARPASLQLVRDWNACLINQQWHHAMAYESAYFIWVLGQEQFPGGVSQLTDAEIANQIAERHAQIRPIPTVDGTNLTDYETEMYRVDTSKDRYEILGLDIWIAPLNEDGDWIEWPSIVTVEWDGTQFVIVSTTQQGVPESDFQRNDAVPETTPDS